MSNAKPPVGGAHGRSEIEAVLDRIARRVKEWCAGMSLYDDLTFVVMKVK